MYLKKLEKVVRLSIVIVMPVFPGLRRHTPFAVPLFTFPLITLRVLGLALVFAGFGAFGNSIHAEVWLNETFEQYTVASPATAPTTALSPLLQFISSGTTVVGTPGNQMCRYFKPTSTALVLASHQYSLSPANATPRPKGYISFKVVQNTPPSPVVDGSEFYLRLGSNDNTKMSSSATAFIDLKFSPSVAPATTCAFSVRSGDNIQSVITTVSATAQSTVKIWYNSGSVGMPYTDPAGFAQTLSAGSYVCYVNDVLANASPSGTTLVSSVITGGTEPNTTIGKLAFGTASGNTVDFSVDDIYAADSAPVLGVAITSPTTATAQAGYSFSYQIGTSGGTPTSYDATGLPSYLTINKTSGLISGTVPINAPPGALSAISLSATGTAGKATSSLTLTIAAAPTAAPVINSAATASGFLTKDFNYQIATSTTSPSSTPTSYAIATGTLPAGLSINTATGLISGKPTKLTPDGGTQITYTATNPFGTSNPKTLTITISPVPVFTWNNTGTIWTNASSWTNNAVPANSASTDIAAFGSSGSSASRVDVGVGQSIGGIVFNSGAYAYTWTGTDIIVGGTSGITNNSTNIQTFDNKIINTGANSTWTSVSRGAMVFKGGIDLSSTGANRTVTFGGAGNVTVSGAIANGGTATNGAVTFSSTGVNLLSGTNTYGGPTTVSGGTLILSGSNSSSGYVLSGYADDIYPVLKVNALSAFSPSAKLTGSSSTLKAGTLELATSGNYTLNQYAGNNMNFSNSSGSNTTLTFTNAISIISPGGSGKTLANKSANLTITFNGAVDITGYDEDACTISAVGPVVISNRVFNFKNSYTRSLVKEETGNLTMYGVNDYDGTTTVSMGTLSIPTGGSLAGCGDTIVEGGVASANSANLNLAGAAGVVQVGQNGFVRGYTSGSTTTLGTITSLQVQDAGTVEVTLGRPWTTGGTIDFAAGSKVSVTGTPSPGNIYTLMTANAPITGTTPILVGATGWALRVTGSSIYLEKTSATDGFDDYLSSNGLVGTAFNDKLNGVTVGLKYAFGSANGMPQNNGVTALPVMSGNQLTYTFDVKDDSALTVKYQTSTDLVTWATAIAVGNGTGTATDGFLRKQVQVSGSGKLFLRINVTR